MDYDLDARTANLGVGELAGFSLGPREGGDGAAGLWRAELGQRWHRELQTQATQDHGAAAAFEVGISGRLVHAGWVITLTGRIDQVITRQDHVLLREVKTLTDPLPRPEDELRAERADWFAQLATYLALHALPPGAPPARGELVCVEADTGLAQCCAVRADEDGLLRVRLQRVVEFLNLRLRARERLRGLVFAPAFSTLRPGQESTRAELDEALTQHRLIALEAPTGFGKTGILLESALSTLRAGRFQRLLYLTSKATGQLQVRETLTRMTTAAETGADAGPRVALWHVRNKAEHCINTVFHCVREVCPHLHQLEQRWEEAGLARFYRFEHESRDLANLRAAGRAARVCPYEITRTALAFQDVWIGDYNYVFAPRNRRLFEQQPGWDATATLLVVDEAHNLPSRVADAHSHRLRSLELRRLLGELDGLRAPGPLRRATESLTLLVDTLRACDALDLPVEDDLGDCLRELASAISTAGGDLARLSPESSQLLWSLPDLAAWLTDTAFAKLLWCPRPSELAFTCLESAPLIAARLRDFGAVVLASATFGPPETANPALGLDPGDLHRLVAHTPWRDEAYTVAYDVRVDTSYRHRASHLPLTAATVAALHAAATGPVVVFFPSYAYAEAVARALDQAAPELRLALQPRLPDLAAQEAWVEQALVFSDVVGLVLGSSFAEGIDALGGRVTHAMVVGPALPEVNAVQRARLAAEERRLGQREAAAAAVYRAPGLQKVNQALGRLVRAPGQRVKVLLHCRRFIEPAYASLLARDYQFGDTLSTDAELATWLRG